MDRRTVSLIGATVVVAGLIYTLAQPDKERVHELVGDEVVTISPAQLPEPYVVDSYESSVTLVDSWDYLEADTTPLLEIEPVEDYIYDYILDEELTELPPLQ